MELLTKRDVGLFIRDRRRRRGWTQEQLATMLGKTRRWMMQVELGQTNADMSSVLRALRLLDVALVPVDLPATEPNPLIEQALNRATRGSKE